MILRILVARERGRFVGWSIAFALYFLVIAVSYLAIKDQPQYDELWEGLPESVREAFGGSASITSPEGYLESQATSLLPLALGGIAAAQATKRLAGAEQSGELDLLLSLPVTRLRYLAAHSAVTALLLAACTAAAALGTVVGFAVAGVQGGDLARLAYMVAETLPFGLGLMAIGLWAGAAFHRRGPALAVTIGALTAFFLAQVVASLADATAWLAWGSPYAVWLKGDPFALRTSPMYLAWVAGLLLASLPSAARAWARKDLRA